MTVANDSSPSEATTSASGDETVPFADCRPAYYGETTECMGTGTYDAVPNATFASFACSACVCLEYCEHDDDCTDHGAPVEARCLVLTNPIVSACFLVCEDDGDCPTELVCLASDALAEKACYLPWRKPECCEQGAPNC